MEVFELVRQDFNFNPLRSKEMLPLKSNKEQEEEVIFKERVINNAKMPNIQKLSIRVETLPKKIQEFKFPNLTELNIKIRKAPNI